MIITTKIHVRRLLCAAMFAGFSSASLAQATRDKCTCAIDGDTVGSVVLNAGACLQTRKSNWCDVQVSALQQSNRHSRIVGTINSASEQFTGEGRVDALGEVLKSLLDEYVDGLERHQDTLREWMAANGVDDSATMDRTSSEKELIEQARSTLDSVLPDISDAFGACLVAFAAREPLDGRPGFDQANCGVNETTGWLSILIVVAADASVEFLIGPLQR